MSYLTTFIDVGRSKFCGERRTQDAPSYEDLLSAIRGKLMSSEIEFLYNPRDLENLEKGEINKINGIVSCGGFRRVGDFSIEKVSEEIQNG